MLTELLDFKKEQRKLGFRRIRPSDHAQRVYTPEQWARILTEKCLNKKGNLSVPNSLLSIKKTKR
jgi:hypothetical protein